MWDTQRRREFIRASVREKLEADGVLSRSEVIDGLVAELIAWEHDIEQILRAEVGSVYDREAASRKDGMRRSEVTYKDGERMDVTHEQLTIPQLEDAARRKRDHGEATIAEADMDLAVAAEARRRCRLQGLDIRTTLVGAVLTREEIVAIRRGDEGTGLRVAA